MLILPQEEGGQKWVTWASHVFEGYIKKRSRRRRRRRRKEQGKKDWFLTLKKRKSGRKRLKQEILDN